MKTFSLLSLAACLLAMPAVAAAKSRTPTHDIQLGVQAWTFNKGTFAEAVDRISAMGVRYVQAYPRQKIGGGIEGRMVPSMDAATRAQVLAMLKAKNVTLSSYGVVRAKTEAEWREIFDFARAMGLRDIAVEPPRAEWPEVFPLLDRLAREYGVAVTLHNHPNPNNPPADVVAALAPYGPHLGFCADTGHWARSGFDPVESLRVAGPRLISVHFKDLTEVARKAHDVPWGTGACNAAGQLAELRRQGFQGIVYVEYEHRTPALPEEVARSVEFFRRAAAAGDEDLISGRVVPPGFSDESAALPPPGAGKNSLRWPSAQPLFAADLSNAEFKPGSWAWEDGVLVAKGGGEIWTKESFQDFGLSLEFRCEEKSNSGVLLRCTDPRNWLNNAIEVQILQGDAENEKHLAGAIFDCLAPNQQVQIEPGRWHRLVIIAKKSRINVILDGETVTEMNLSLWKEPGRNPDGTPNKFTRAYHTMTGAGRIGLQYHGSPIAFRNLVIDRW